MPTKLPEYTIIRDTREKDKHGWFWEPEDKIAGKCRVIGTEETGLKSGDYSIKGLEDKVVIERKEGFGELHGNMSPTENKERFINEMERIKDIPHKFILVESCINRDILTLSIPQYRSGPPSRRVLEWLIELQMKYGVHVMFVGDAGKSAARLIFEKVARLYL